MNAFKQVCYASNSCLQKLFPSEKKKKKKKKKKQGKSPGLRSADDNWKTIANIYVPESCPCLVIRSACRNPGQNVRDRFTLLNADLADVPIPHNIHVFQSIVCAKCADSSEMQS